MKKFTTLSGFGLFILFLALPSLIIAQVDKKAAEVKRLETSLNTAKNNVAKHERSIVVADSLIAKGNEQIAESKAEIKAANAERKALDKEYATQKKALEKLSFSKDKAEATQAKADLKALDLKYKTDAKALDTRLKESTKKSSTGTANLGKGKTSKKTATDALNTAQESLDAAQAKYDIATGNVSENAEEGKKKKK